eukprot:766570_1
MMSAGWPLARAAELVKSQSRKMSRAAQSCRGKAQRRSLAETLQQEGSENGHGVVFPAELVRLLDRLEEEIRADRVSSESRAWLAQCGLTVEQLARQVEPEYTPA